MKKLLATVAAVVLTSPALAAPQTVNLSIPNMSCATCPIVVKKAISKVAGVSKVEVNLDKRQATVTFDDAKTNIDAISAASKKAGYPCKVIAAAKS